MPNKIVRIQAAAPQIIAPCGINCSLCRAYIRERQPCPGCRSDDNHKSNACLTCAIKNCPDLAAVGQQFCFACAKFPCAKLQHLDDRYQTRYGVSVIANLARIQAVGAERFVVEESMRWSCPACGQQLCMHLPQCPHCGHTRQS